MNLLLYSGALLQRSQAVCRLQADSALKGIPACPVDSVWSPSHRRRGKASSFGFESSGNKLRQHWKPEQLKQFGEKWG